MAHASLKVKEEPVDSLSFKNLKIDPTPNSVQSGPENIQAKTRKLLGSSHSTHRSSLSDLEYQEPIYNEIERRRRSRSLAPCPQSPVLGKPTWEKDFVQDDAFCPVFGQPSYGSIEKKERNPSMFRKSAPVTEIASDRFLKRIARFQKEKLASGAKMTPAAETKALQPILPIDRTEKLPSSSHTSPKRPRRQLFRRTNRLFDQSTPSKWSQRKYKGNSPADINIVISRTPQNRGKKIKLGEHGGINITLSNNNDKSRSPPKRRGLRRGTRETFDRHALSTRTEDDQRGYMACDEGHSEDDKENFNSEISARPELAEGESLWDFIAAAY